MKQDEIIELAKQAGIIAIHTEGDGNWHQQFVALEAFAKLVAAKEREKSNRLLWLFQEWKEDHLSQHNYIEAVEAIRARGEK